MIKKTSQSKSTLHRPQLSLLSPKHKWQLFKLLLKTMSYFRELLVSQLSIHIQKLTTISQLDSTEHLLTSMLLPSKLAPNCPLQLLSALQLQCHHIRLVLHLAFTMPPQQTMSASVALLEPLVPAVLMLMLRHPHLGQPVIHILDVFFENSK